MARVRRRARALGSEAESALARLSASKSYDVVIIDNKMPGMDGMEFLHRMRRAGHSPEVILVSAYLTDKVRESAALMGVRRILGKPVDIEKLRAAIREVVPLARPTGTGMRSTTVEPSTQRGTSSGNA